MFEAILSPQQVNLLDQVRDFARWVPRQLILDMDADRVRYPRDYVTEAARRNLLGLRFPVEYGGRGLGWTDEIVALEEVGVLGTSLACLYSLPSIVGEALHVFGTPAQKERWLRPIVEGRLTVAEALTEPRGSDALAWAVLLSLNTGLLLRFLFEPFYLMGPEAWLGALMALAGVLQALAAVGFGLLIWGRVRPMEP